MKFDAVRHLLKPTSSEVLEKALRARHGDGLSESAISADEVGLTDVINRVANRQAAAVNLIEYAMEISTPAK